MYIYIYIYIYVSSLPPPALVRTWVTAGWTISDPYWGDIYIYIDR